MKSYPEISVIETSEEASSLRVSILLRYSPELYIYVYDCLVATAKLYDSKKQAWPSYVEDLMESLFGNSSMIFPPGKEDFYKVLARQNELAKFEFVSASFLLNSLPFRKVSGEPLVEYAGVKDINMLGDNGKLISLRDARNLITVMVLGESSEARVYALKGIISGLELISKSKHINKVQGIEILVDEAVDIAEVYISRVQKGKVGHLEPRGELIKLFEEIKSYTNSKKSQKPLCELINICHLSKPVLNF